jgi:hypothetical protein
VEVWCTYNENGVSFNLVQESKEGITSEKFLQPEDISVASVDLALDKAYPPIEPDQFLEFGEERDQALGPKKKSNLFRSSLDSL